VALVRKAAGDQLVYKDTMPHYLEPLSAKIFMGELMRFTPAGMEFKVAWSGYSRQLEPKPTFRMQEFGCSYFITTCP